MLYVLHLSWVLLLLTLAPAYAEIYTWVDRDGRVHCTTTIAGIPQHCQQADSCIWLTHLRMSQGRTPWLRSMHRHSPHSAEA